MVGNAHPTTKGNMKKITHLFYGFLIVLTALWLWADNIITTPLTFLPARESLMNYTGIIAISVMSVGMIIAIRPARLEPFFGGLDKMYRLHKWLGISALTFSVVHWAIKQSPGWLSGLGLITLPPRGPRGARAVVEGFSMQQTLGSLRGVAEFIGEWSFYVAAVLMVLALVKYFPYRLFFKTHHFLIFLYLLLVFHAVVLMKFAYWSSVIGVLTGVLMLAGSAAALGILFKQTGKDRRAVALVEALEYHPDSKVLKVAVKLKDRWLGHEAGQFAFATFTPDEAPHPFTISSAWTGDGRMFFLIKELGDYTQTLAAKLKVGDTVKLEGPYGQFNFKHPKPRQIWVAGGIGITPFVARMKALAAANDGKAVDLIFCVSELDEKGLNYIQQDATAAGVNLHILYDKRDGRLNAERLCEMMPDWQNASIWFCGPAAFGDQLQADLAARGLNSGDFHREMFSMR